MDHDDEDFLLQQELESLADAASLDNMPDDNGADDNDHPSHAPEPISNTIARWTKLFDLSPDSAVDLVMAHRRDLTRLRLSDAHWETVRAEKAAEGYDREAYEYSLGRMRKAAALAPSIASSDRGVGEEMGRDGVAYLVELTGSLRSAEDVRRAAGIQDVPPVVGGMSVEEGTEVELCCVDAVAKGRILEWAASHGAGFEPTVLVDPRSLRARAR